jgi:hypothetical protein
MASPLRRARRGWPALGRLRPLPDAPPTASATGAGSPDRALETYDAGLLLARCLEKGVDARPHYLWGVLAGAITARSLGVEQMSAIELGVAGGNGLVALEVAAQAAEELLGVKIEVWGFDCGTGLPEPLDYRDVPWVAKAGYFAMDVDDLRRRLTRAELVLGPVRHSVPVWLTEAHAPIGFVSFDLDYYSSTKEAFALFEAGPERLLPRISCYFDDVLGAAWNDYNGERAAIAEFNDTHHLRKVAATYGLRFDLPMSEQGKPWPEKVWHAHLFDHPRYNEFALELPPSFFESHRLAPE